MPTPDHSLHTGSDRHECPACYRTEVAHRRAYIAALMHGAKPTHLLTKTDRVAMYLFRTAPAPQAFATVMQACDIAEGHSGTLAAALKRLAAAGVVEQVARGLYRGLPLSE